jgi:hypothetical protein
MARRSSPVEEELSKLSIDNPSDSDDHSENDGECAECKGRGNKPVRTMKALRVLTEEVTLKQFAKCIEEASFASRYCCGGILANVPNSSRTTLRWDDPSEEGLSRKCHFPIGSELTEDGVTSVVAQLSNACDENGILEATNFTINIDPHSEGILDVISQLLLPGFRSAKLKSRPEHRGLKATLTKLHVSQILF